MPRLCRTGQHPTPALCNAGAMQARHAPEGPAAAADSEGVATDFMRTPTAAAVAAPAPEVSAPGMPGSSTAAALQPAELPQPAGRASAAPPSSDAASSTDRCSTPPAVKPERASQLAVGAGGVTRGPEPSATAGDAEGASQPAGGMGDSSGPESHALAPEDWLDLASVPPSGYATRQGSGLPGHEAEGRSAVTAPTRMVGSCAAAKDAACSIHLSCAAGRCVGALATSCQSIFFRRFGATVLQLI